MSKAILLKMRVISWADFWNIIDLNEFETLMNFFTGKIGKKICPTKTYWLTRERQKEWMAGLLNDGASFVYVKSQTSKSARARTRLLTKHQ